MNSKSKYLLLFFSAAILFLNSCGVEHHSSKKSSKRNVIHKKVVKKKAKAKTSAIRKPIDTDEVHSKKNTVLKTKSETVIKPIQQPKSSAKQEKNYDKYLAEHYAEVLATNPGYVRKSLPLYRFVDMWIGVPYRYGGNTMNGIDCSAFAKSLYDEVYHYNLTREGNAQYQQCMPVSKEELMEGDLLFFKIGTKRISHVAVYLGNNKFVHASSGKGVTISDLTEAYYARYFFSGGRIVDNIH